MALNPLTLNITSGIVGRPFSATISGLTAGSTVVAISNDGTQGFFVVGSTVMNNGLPYAINNLLLRETLPGTGTRDSAIQIRADGIALGVSGLPGALAALGVEPAGNRLCYLGDSRGFLGVSANGSMTNVGILTWLRALSRQRFTFTGADNFAVTGYTTQQIIDNLLAGAVASAANTCMVLASTNDRTASGGVTASVSIANLTTIRDALLAVGKRVVFIAELPRGDSTFTALRLTSPQSLYHMQVHQWLLAQAAVPGVFVVDPWPAWIATPSSTTQIDAVLGYTVDGLHPAQIGAYQIAKAALPTVNVLFPPTENLLPATAFDIYDATNNPRGVLSQGVMTTGTSGTVNAPGAGTMTGNLASSHVATLNNGTGVTVTLSKVTIAGAEWQQAAISGTPTSASSYLSIRLFGASVTAGDIVEGSCEFQVDAAQTGLGGINLTIGDALGATYQDFSGTVMAFPTDALDGVLRVPPSIITGTGNETESINIFLLQNVAVSATVRFRRMNARKVLP